MTRTPDLERNPVWIKLSKGQQKGGDEPMMALTPGRKSTSCAALWAIAAQDHRIGWLTAELARLRGWEAAAVLDDPSALYEFRRG